MIRLPLLTNHNRAALSLSLKERQLLAAGDEQTTDPKCYKKSTFFIFVTILRRTNQISTSMPNIGLIICDIFCEIVPDDRSKISTFWIFVTILRVIIRRKNPISIYKHA